EAAFMGAANGLRGEGASLLKSNCDASCKALIGERGETPQASAFREQAGNIGGVSRMRTEKRPLRRALATALAAACLVFSPLFADLSAAQEDLGAQGRPAKFLGNVWSTSQRTNWLDHWNQVTPENEGKWASV